MTIVAISL